MWNFDSTSRPSRRSTLIDRRRLAIGTGLVCLLLAACQIDPPHARYPELTFEHKPPMRFDVSEVEIRTAYLTPMVPPHVEHLMPLPPSRAARDWARDRLRAAGTERRLVFSVREASVIETRLPATSGAQGLLVVDQSERYDANLVLEITIVDDSGRQTARAEVRAKRSITVPEDADLNQREALWFSMTEKLMRDADYQLELTLKQYFSRYLLR